ncbi:hypothetical protein ACQP0C_27710 [Nocardia sp. CA-129566]|uniref:hypothetical protein n=1 Tax=Nocardia sp. CA-129566 TaxID=3239976 RepID=UPI003D972189
MSALVTQLDRVAQVSPLRHHAIRDAGTVGESTLVSPNASRKAVAHHKIGVGTLR